VEAAPSIAVPQVDAGLLSPAGTSPLGDFHASFAEFHEGYVRHYISLADTKAAWAFTVASGAIAFVFSRTESRAELLHPQWSVETTLVWAAISFLCLSALFSFLVISPRRSSSSADGIVFFGHVAAKANADAYISAVADHDQASLAAERLAHCYDISRVCASKYTALRAAIWFGLLGIVFALSQLLRV
jgi:hypothetical protein